MKFSKLKSMSFQIELRTAATWYPGKLIEIDSNFAVENPMMWIFPVDLNNAQA